MEKLVVSAAEAAKLISTSQETVLNMIRNGEIKAYRSGKGWKIPVQLLQTAVIDKAVQETRERRKHAEQR